MNSEILINVSLTLSQVQGSILKTGSFKWIMVNLRKSVKFQKKIRLTNTHITSRIAIKLAEKNGGYGFQRFKLHLIKWTV